MCRRLKAGHRSPEMPRNDQTVLEQFQKGFRRSTGSEKFQKGFREVSRWFQKSLRGVFQGLQRSFRAVSFRRGLKSRFVSEGLTGFQRVRNTWWFQKGFRGVAVDRVNWNRGLFQKGFERGLRGVAKGSEILTGCRGVSTEGVSEGFQRGVKFSLVRGVSEGFQTFEFVLTITFASHGFVKAFSVMCPTNVVMIMFASYGFVKAVLRCVQTLSGRLRLLLKVLSRLSWDGFSSDFFLMWGPKWLSTVSVSGGLWPGLKPLARRSKKVELQITVYIGLERGEGTKRIWWEARSKAILVFFSGFMCMRKFFRVTWFVKGSLGI